MKNQPLILGNKKLDAHFFPSNPCNYFTSGSDQECFTFKERENGELFYLLIRKRGHFAVSFIVKAIDQNDVLQLLKDLIDFRIKCFEKYKGKKLTTNSDFELMEMAKEYIQLTFEIKGILESSIDSDYRISIQKIESNQFFKTGWASNDISL